MKDYADKSRIMRTVAQGQSIGSKQVIKITSNNSDVCFKQSAAPKGLKALRR